MPTAHSIVRTHRNGVALCSILWVFGLSAAGCFGGPTSDFPFGGKDEDSHSGGTPGAGTSGGTTDGDSTKQDGGAGAPMPPMTPGDAASDMSDAGMPDAALDDAGTSIPCDDAGDGNSTEQCNLLPLDAASALEKELGHEPADPCAGS